MKRSADLFRAGEAHDIEDRVREVLNQNRRKVSPDICRNPRSVGERIPELLQDNLDQILSQVCVRKDKTFSRMHQLDFAFWGENDHYYGVDVKTRRLDPGRHQSNLTSIKRLAEFYEDDRKYFVVLLVEYSVKKGDKFVPERVRFVPIEAISWRCLAIRNLGYGQLQLDRELELVPHWSRRRWMCELVIRAKRFYEELIEAMQGPRLAWCAQLAAQWSTATTSGSEVAAAQADYRPEDNAVDWIRNRIRDRLEELERDAVRLHAALAELGDHTLPER